MDCYFHSNVPSVAPCIECGKPICATCRDERGGCPSCRLAAKVEAATATRQQIPGRCRRAPRPRAFAERPRSRPRPIRSKVARLVALGYPLWPLALISLLDRKQSRALRRQAFQALGFNVGFFGFWCAAVADRAGSVPRNICGMGARAAAGAALSGRERLLRHQDLERRRRARTHRQQLARRTIPSPNLGNL